jgi:MoxR-like ATPase
MSKSIAQIFNRLRDSLSEIVVGQIPVIDQLLIAVLAEGHVLLEGVPGTAKTLLVKTLSSLIDIDFGRIQLTPDMLPSDILGTSVYDLNSRSFTIKRGPIFTGLLLADEINRTPPKTQSALLEAMEEGQVSLDGHTEALPDVFMVVATQNPVEFEGTYPLPEAQLDRFMLKVIIDYPEATSELLMLQNWQKGAYKKRERKLEAVTSSQEILDCRKALDGVTVDPTVLDYLMQIVHKSRQMSDISLGASPRAALNWLAAAKSHAAIEGKDFVTPDNIKFVAEPILRHRLILTPESELEGITLAQVITNLLKTIPVPR